MNKKGTARFTIIFLAIILLFTTSDFSLSQPKSYNKLAVVITANGNSIKVKGIIVFMKDGKEIKKEIEKDNAWGWNFLGDYIEEVHIRKISGDASYHLFVIENNNFLFESKSIKSNKPVVYRRN